MLLLPSALQITQMGILVREMMQQVQVQGKDCRQCKSQFVP